MSKMTPISDSILVKPFPVDDVTRGGIVIPENYKHSPEKGEIMAMGPGRINKNGKRIEMETNVGDVVLFDKYAGTRMKIGDDDYIMMGEFEALAIIK